MTTIESPRHQHFALPPCTPRLSTTWMGVTSSSSPRRMTPELPSWRLQRGTPLSESSTPRDHNHVALHGNVNESLTSARKITDYQRAIGGSQRAMTEHVTGGKAAQMEKMSFDAVYSDKYAHMDTNSALGTQSLMPVFDARTQVTRPAGLRYGGEHMIQTGHGPRLVLPSRSFVLPSQSTKARAAVPNAGFGPSRHIDF